MTCSPKVRPIGFRPATDPNRPTGAKVIINDTDHSFGWGDLINNGLQGAARNGCGRTSRVAPTWAFMDPYLVVWPGRNAPSGNNPDPYWETIRNNLGYTRLYADRMNLAAATPQNSLSVHFVRPGQSRETSTLHFSLFQTRPSPSTWPLGPYNVEWFNTNTGVTTAGGMISGGASRDFTAPFSGSAVLYLTVTAPVAPPTPTELAATPSDRQITLAWVASSGRRYLQHLPRHHQRWSRQHALSHRRQRYVVHGHGPDQPARPTFTRSLPSMPPAKALGPVKCQPGRNRRSRGR